MIRRKDRFNYKFNNNCYNCIIRAISIMAIVATVSCMVSVINNWEAISFAFGG